LKSLSIEINTANALGPAILLPLLGHADRLIDNDKIAAVHESACGTKRTLDSRLLIASLKRVAEELKKRAAPANDNATKA
jgi:crotonobetainyl-CoA:carnitine CoA-transferase CaiB-like acyl-CoA transferase